ncbi:MAG: ABC transporter ATP-binding protein [Candidatus Hodarchaeales archaeon]|jgi:ABC-type multidrug transport system ATPase subunit
MSSKPQNDSPIVELSNINKVYGFTIALKKINLVIEEGETIGFIGNNGAGKSTLLKIISLLVTPSSGEIKLFDTEVKENHHLLKKDIGVLLSQSFFFSDLTGRENLEFYLKMNKRTDKPKEIVNQIIPQYNLKLFIDRPTHELSTGMAKKLEILRVSSPTLPKLLLLDEPFSGLDVENKQFITHLIRNRPKDRTVIICSHDFNTIAQLCDRVAYIEKGRITKVLTPSEYDYFLIKQT